MVIFGVNTLFLFFPCFKRHLNILAINKDQFYMHVFASMYCDLSAYKYFWFNWKDSLMIGKDE